MSRAISIFVVSMIFGVAASAGADVPGPYDHLCTVDNLERDGAQCETCTRVASDPSAPDACAPLVARGWFRRCSKGATVNTTVFCDRDGPPPEELGNGGGGCAIAPSQPAAPAVVLFVAALALLARRRARG